MIIFLLLLINCNSSIDRNAILPSSFTYEATADNNWFTAMADAELQHQRKQLLFSPLLEKQNKKKVALTASQSNCGVIDGERNPRVQTPVSFEKDGLKCWLVCLEMRAETFGRKTTEWSHVTGAESRANLPNVTPAPTVSATLNYTKNHLTYSKAVTLGHSDNRARASVMIAVLGARGAPWLKKSTWPSRSTIGAWPSWIYEWAAGSPGPLWISFQDIVIKCKQRPQQPLHVLKNSMTCEILRRIWL